MNQRILVGNLSTSVDELQIKDLFSETVGTIVSITIPKDPKTGNCRGYAFVEMAGPIETKAAIDRLNGQELAGRAIALTLSESAPKSKRKWYQFGAPKQD
jgi:RNA recognition motif-containing protein